MSVVTVQLGQCGNQLGEELLNSLDAEAARARSTMAAAVRRVYFAERRASDVPWRARSVLVDTEPRVVQRCMEDEDGSRGGSWCYSKASTVWKQGGAANNWSHGFCIHGPAMAEEVLDRVRREAEGCDRLEGFLALHSVAGGTGSGLGSFVLQLLRDSFPSSTLASVSVWPFESGEVSIQSYNAVLSLGALYEHTDMAIVCENQRYLDVCRLTLREANPSFKSLNKAICESLVRALLPCRAGSSSSGMVCSLLRSSGHLCAHPLYRLVTPRAVPQVSLGARAFATDSWVGLQRRMVQMVDAGSIADCVEGGGLRSPNRAVAAAAFLWGSGACEVPLDGLRGLPAWRWSLEPPLVHADTHQVGGLERSIGLLSNCQTVLPPLAAAGEKASAMLKASAYVHQYERCGVSREELSHALLQLSQVKSDYERL
mmetsp:Transcript_148675/g.477418  ORF Transcript_148675/g.477418 Transcript_148675/m.477418 type:complete len:428 (-) Transcript_148675:26-1309(-)